MHSESAEKSVLASMLVSEDAQLTGIEQLQKADFYIGSHKKIFVEMKKIIEKNEQPDIVTLSDKGIDEQQLSSISESATHSNIQQHIDILKKHTLYRQLEKAKETINNQIQQKKDPKEIIHSVDKKLMDLNNYSDPNEVATVQDTLSDVFSQMDAEEDPAIKTCLFDLDKKTTGLHNGEMTVIAARPGMGKTALMLSISRNIADEKGVLIFSLEMPKTQLVQRLLCMESEVDIQKIRAGNLAAEEKNKINTAAANINNSYIYLDDSAYVTPAKIRAQAKKLVRNNSISCCFVDYMQLMESDTKSETTNNKIEKISRDLKIIAKDLNIPVVALSQLSRAGENRNSKTPVLSDLRNSGAIEQDADVVLFPYRPKYATGEETNESDKIIIAKQRNGPPGTAKVNFVEEVARYENENKILKKKEEEF